MWGLRSLPLALFIAGLLAAIGAGFQTKKLNETKLQESFDALSARAVVQLATRISTYEYGLRGARGALIAAGDRLSREGFSHYSQSWDLAREFPGALGYGYIRRIPVEKEAEFLEEARRDGAPNFAIKSFGPNLGERFITQYMEPAARNEAAIGRDLASDPVRKEGALSALDSGNATLTGPLKLVQTTNNATGLVFLLPIYRAGEPIRSPEERRRAGVGWVFTAFSLEDVLSDFDYLNGEFFISISDITDEAHPITLFNSIPGQHVAAAGLIKSIPVDAYGRSWMIDIKAQPPFVNHLNLYNPLAVFLMIASLSALIASLLYIYFSNLERALKAGLAQAHLAAIVEHSSDAIIGETPNGIITSWNKAAEQMFGYTAAEAIGRATIDLAVPEERVAEVETIFSLIRRGETIAQFTTVRRRSDGSRFDASINISPIRSRSGEVVGAAKIVRDISLEKAAEARILELNSTLEQQVVARTAEVHAYSNLQRAILAEAGYAIIATDTEGRITLFNPAAEALLGYTAGEVVGHANLTIVHDNGELAAHAEALSRELGTPIEAGFEAIVAKSRAGAADGKEWTYVRKDRSRLPVLLSVSALRDNDGPISGHLAIAFDLTERNQRAGELSRARDAAEAASRAKSQFLANMSHEIRTPMNAINGFLQLLSRTDLSYRQQDYVQKSTAASISLRGLINDILDFSKIESGKLELDHSPFSLEEVLRNLSAVLSAAPNERDVDMLFDIAPEIPDHLGGDSLRLQQVLLNLVGNAVKFTREGEVVLRILLKERLERSVRLEFIVADTGIGIATEQLPKIFEGFVQAETSTTRRFGGTGLGLAISQRLVRLMGGTIEVTSKLGVGSTFCFTIELPVEQIAGEPPVLHKGRRLLLIEDNETSQHILTAMLGALEADPTVVKFQHEALYLLSEGHSYDAILIDRNMRDKSAFEAVQRIRTIEDGGTRTPVVLLTGFDYERLAAASPEESTSVDMFLAKPFTRAMLADAITTAIEGRRDAGRRRPIQPMGEPRLSDLTLLVVEDNPINQQIARELLELEGAKVTVAGDGAEAIRRLSEQGEVFDAVLMDIQMPAMDGYETTRALRKDPNLTDLPIIAMTANTMIEDRENSLAAGMNDHIGKPIELETLVAALLRHCRAGEGGASDLNVSAALARLGGNRPLYDKLVQSYLLTRAQAPLAIDTMLEKGDIDGARREAHTLKSIAATLGAMRLSELSATVEHRLEQGDTDGSLGGLVADMLAEDRDLCERLKTLLTTPTGTDQPLLSPERAMELLLEIRAQLEKRNLRAMDLYEENAAGFPPDLISPGGFLSQAMARLDFEGALSEIDAVLGRIEATQDIT
ncbi:CHASE domain-containing protein [Lacibacterium aquatile]|uniref:histidine kinase n=1 Tax=Lacibacterium aquatile TaxID=1168082 RepID=A0ABW5DWC3_9PROT